MSPRLCNRCAITLEREGRVPVICRDCDPPRTDVPRFSEPEADPDWSPRHA